MLQVLLLLLPLCSARPDFRDRIPNGKAADNPDSGLTCVRVGHVECDPSTATSSENNAFGIAFKDAGLQWTKELCEADSDGDGKTNGEELGDPCCEWDPNLKNDQVLRKTGLSNPGDVEETTDAEGCPATPTDVAPPVSPVPKPSESGSPSASMNPSETPTSTSSNSASSGEGTANMSPDGGSGAGNDGGDDDGDTVCFPSSASVRLVDGSSKQMSDLTIGDIVQVAHLSPSSSSSSSHHTDNNNTEFSFSPIIGFSHRLDDVLYGDFVTITSSDGSSLTLTSGHFTYAPSLKAARDVRVGDALPHGPNGGEGRRTVVKVVHGVTDRGLYNPHTETGTIVVNGLVTSCYTESVGVHKAHALLTVVRAMWRMMPTEYRGRPGWAMLDIADDRRRKGQQQEEEVKEEMKGGARNGGWWWQKEWEMVGLRSLLPLVRSRKV